MLFVIENRRILLETSIREDEKVLNELEIKLNNTKESIDAITQYEIYVAEYRKANLKDANSAISEYQASKLNEMKFLEDLLEKKKLKIAQEISLSSEINNLKANLKVDKESIRILESLLQGHIKVQNSIPLDKNLDESKEKCNLLNSNTLDEKVGRENLLINRHCIGGSRKEQKKLSIQNLIISLNVADFEKNPSNVMFKTNKSSRSLKNLGVLKYDTTPNSPTFDLNPNQYKKMARKSDLSRNNYERLSIIEQRTNYIKVKNATLNKNSKKLTSTPHISELYLANSLSPKFNNKANL